MIVMLDSSSDVGIAMLITGTIERSVGQLSPEFIAATFILLSLTIFNLVQWEGLTFSYGLCFSRPMPFLLQALSVWNYSWQQGEAKYWRAAFHIAGACNSRFWRNASFSFARRCAPLHLLFLTRRNSLKRIWLRVVIIGLIFSDACVFIYV